MVLFAYNPLMLPIELRMKFTLSDMVDKACHSPGLYVSPALFHTQAEDGLPFSYISLCRGLNTPSTVSLRGFAWFPFLSDFSVAAFM